MDGIIKKEMVPALDPSLNGSVDSLPHLRTELTCHENGRSACDNDKHQLTPGDLTVTHPIKAEPADASLEEILQEWREPLEGLVPILRGTLVKVEQICQEFVRCSQLVNGEPHALATGSNTSRGNQNIDSTSGLNCSWHNSSEVEDSRRVNSKVAVITRHSSTQPPHEGKGSSVSSGVHHATSNSKERDTISSVEILDLTHDVGEIFEYNMCQMFKKTILFKEHIGAHEQDQKHHCKLCDKQFTVPRKFNNHNHICDPCCNSARLLRQSSMLQLDNDRADLTQNGKEDQEAESCSTKQCKVCNKYVVKLAQHLRIHTGERPYHCKECGKQFPYDTSLKIHMMTHTGDRPFLCDACGRRFPSNSCLTIHMRSHTGEKPYKCKLCDKGFARSTKLNTHFKSHIGDKRYQCDVCGKLFLTYTILKTHSLVHSSDKPFKCNICYKCFDTSTELTDHGELHRMRPFQCKVCDKQFSNSSNLTKHTRVHTGHKPYHCKECNRRFADSSGLNVHTRVHTGEKPYHCKVCFKKFATSGACRSHMRVHM